MDIKEIKGIPYKLYDDSKEFKIFCPNEEIVDDWRCGQLHDWVSTDDGYICQVLAKTKLNHPSYKTLRTMIRTVCGSFIVEQKTHKMIGKHGVAENIYAFSGNYDSIKDRKVNRKLKNREFLFARYVAEGDDILNAYKKAYPKAKNKTYIRNKTSTLLNKEGIRTMVKEEIKKILAEEGVSPEWIVEKYKMIADLSDRDSDRLRSLEALANMIGLFDKEKKQEQLTVFTGFTPEQMEAISGGKETKLVAHKEKRDKK
jgi:hypothetical protein